MSGLEGKEGILGTPYMECTKYFENNTMRPILFIMERINNTAGIQALYANFTIEIQHKIKVRCWHKDGLNRNEKFDMMVAGNAVDTANFPATQGIPDLNDLRIPRYYLQTVHDGTIGGQKNVFHCERSTMYIPSYFPVLIPGATEEEDKSCM